MLIMASILIKSVDCLCCDCRVSCCACALFTFSNVERVRFCKPIKTTLSTLKLVNFAPTVIQIHTRPIQIVKGNGQTINFTSHAAANRTTRRVFFLLWCLLFCQTANLCAKPIKQLNARTKIKVAIKLKGGPLFEKEQTTLCFDCIHSGMKFPTILEKTRLKYVYLVLTRE
jgi:hypothetical protein